MMARNMMEIGKMINRMDMGFFIILMEMCIKDFGKIIEQMGKVFILVRMEEDMKDFGLMMCKMVLGLKNGMMVVLI